jgi:hypothetical protein
MHMLMHWVPSRFASIEAQFLVRQKVASVLWPADQKSYLRLCSTRVESGVPEPNSTDLDLWCVGMSVWKIQKVS